MDWPGTLQAQPQQWPGKPVAPQWPGKPVAPQWPGVRQAAKAPPDPNAAKLDAASRIPVSGDSLRNAESFTQAAADKSRSFVDRLGNALVAEGQNVGKGIWGAVSLPGEVAQGKVDPMSQEGIERATNLAGLVAGGEFGGERVPLAAKATREIPKVEGVRPNVADIQKLKAAETTLPEAPQWPGRKQGEAAVEGALKPVAEQLHDRPAVQELGAKPQEWPGRDRKSVV